MDPSLISPSDLTAGPKAGLTFIYYMTTKKSKGFLSNLKEGAFTAQAKRAGMSVQHFANEVVNHPHLYNETTRKRAQFAINAKKFKH